MSKKSFQRRCTFQYTNQPTEGIDVVVVANPEEIGMIRITLTNEVVPTVKGGQIILIGVIEGIP